jgi:hypothetical protein
MGDKLRRRDVMKAAAADFSAVCAAHAVNLGWQR